MPIGISNVSFCSNGMSAQDILSRPGAYTKPQEGTTVQPQQKPAHKKSGYVKKTGIVLITAAAIAGGLYALPKFFPKVFDAAKDLNGLKGFDKYKSYATTYIAKAGNWIGTKTSNAYNAVAKFLHIKK